MVLILCLFTVCVLFLSASISFQSDNENKISKQISQNRLLTTAAPGSIHPNTSTPQAKITGADDRSGPLAVPNPRNDYIIVSECDIHCLKHVEVQQFQQKESCFLNTKQLSDVFITVLITYFLYTFYLFLSAVMISLCAVVATVAVILAAVCYVK